MTVERLGLFAKKLGMTQLFMEDGLRIPVTVLQVEPNYVVAKRTVDISRRPTCRRCACCRSTA
jgi:ribosomal protein L3